MSFSGFGARGFSRGAQQGSGQGPQGQPASHQDAALHRAIRNLISDGQDAEVQSALVQHYHALPSCDQPSTSVIVNQAVQLLGLAGGDLAPRRAVILLAEARWNYAAAAQAALDEVAAAREDSLSGSEEGGDIEGTEEEVSDEAGSEGVKGLDFESRMRLLNRGIDREVAKKGKPDPSKLTIRIKQLGGQPDKVLRYREVVDFSQPVRALNRWRSQIFRRHLGGSRPFRTRFHELEKDFLYDEHVAFEQRRRADGLVVDYSAMRWVEIAGRFNQRFEGKILPGASEPRPARTKVALRTERSRIARITDHTGIAPKNQEPALNRPRERRRAEKAAVEVGAEIGEEEQEEGDEEEGEGEDGSRGIRRGDPPPGKPPRRDPEDEGGAGATGTAVDPRSWRSVVGV